MKKDKGYPLEDNEMEQAAGGMRPIAAQQGNNICPVCGNADTLDCTTPGGLKCRLCPKPGCGTMFMPQMANKIIGVEESIANQK